MADEVSQNIENALNKIVNTADQSGNMRKELKRTIFETVSTLRNLFTKMKGMIDEKTKQNKQMEKEINIGKQNLIHVEV
jgi:3-methyladenine DNA glycosylase Tag